MAEEAERTISDDLLEGALNRAAQNDMVKCIESFHAADIKGCLDMQPHQYEILNHLFTEVDGRLPYDTIIWSCIKKSGKTTIGAAICDAWAQVYGGEIYVIANDLKQAQKRAFRTLVDSYSMFPQDYISTPINRLGINDEIAFRNRARIQAIPCDPYGEAGGMQSLTLWDELWGYRHENASVLWTEMQPLPPGVGAVKESIRVVVTYAGWYGRSDLLWHYYEMVCAPDEQGEEQGQRVRGLEHLPCYHKGRTFVYWDHEPRMPWHTDEFLEKAKADEPRPSEYLRIWENRWTTGLEPFINMDLYDACARLGDEEGLYNRWEDVVL